MKLVVGLGNPGKQYIQTRHNIGFRILDTLCPEWQLMTKTSALICKQDDVIYAKPQTFMNLSGASVFALVQYYEIELQDMLVVYDCKDIPFVN
jgi:PTH1 family peptidyl-tRNA hydrolase